MANIIPFLNDKNSNVIWFKLIHLKLSEKSVGLQLVKEKEVNARAT